MTEPTTGSPDFRLATEGGRFRCPECQGDLWVYGKRSYRVHPVSGAMLKDGMPTFDVVCEHAHVFAEGVTNAHRAVKQAIGPAVASFLESREFADAIAAIQLGRGGATERLRHLIRDQMWNATAWSE